MATKPIPTIEVWPIILETICRNACKDIDTGFVKGFIAHLRKQPYLKSDFTIHGYYRLLNVTLNKAVKKGLILSNPCSLLDTDEKPHKPTSLRTYLTLEELKEVNPDRLRMPRGKKGFSVLLFLRTPDQRLDRS